MVNYHDITERKKTLEALRRSEQNYRNVVQDQSEYIIRYLPDGSITFVNDSFCRAFGTSLEEATSKNVTQGNLESEIIRIKKKIEALTPENPIVSDEHITISIDGEEVWHHWSDRGIFDEEGRLKEIQAVGRDITTRKRIEESLHASSTQLEEAQRLANIGSYILDINNDSWTGADILYEMFGIDDTAELNVAAWSALVHPDDRDEMTAYFASRVANKHTYFDKEYRIVNKKDRGVRWVHGLGEFTFDEEGNPLKMIGVIQDITERKQAQEQREQALLDAQTANRVKDQFISNISHEIRTPLNSILGFSDILNTRYNHVVNPDDAKIFGFINHASQRLMRTVDSILNLSQLEAGTIKTYLHQIDLVSIAKTVIEDSQQIAEEKGLDLALKTKFDQAMVYADEYCMQQVITNLMENAIKFTVQGRVEIEIDRQGSQFVLSVIDSGIGISEDYLKRIYKPYSQESEGFTKNFQGIGLGMALTKRYADLNNVEIKLKSRAGDGTTFTLIFPEGEGN